MDFQEFLIKQEEVYGRFRDTSKVRAEGIVPNVKPMGGYLVVFRHATVVANAVSRFSRRVGEATPSLVYEAGNVHTTLSDYGLSPEFTPREDVLESLTRSAESARQALSQTQIAYSEWLFNQNTAIVAGIPNENFLGAAEALQASAKKEGIELRLPWGAHITMNRFTQTRQPDQLGGLFSLLGEKPYDGKSTPIYLDVGHFTLDENGFDIKVHKRFDLS